MSSILRARFVLPIDRPPLRDGWVEVAEGRIVSVGHGRPPGDARDLGDVALLPGLVNAHTHLELAWMAGRIAPADSMPQWVGWLLDLRAAPPPAARAAAAERDAAAAMAAAGTVLAGDISNTLSSPGPLAAAGLGGVVFHEVVGFNTADPATHVRDAWDRVDAQPARPGIDFSVAAHAPYSTSSGVFREVARRAREAPLTVHLAESAEEVEFLHTGRGPFRELLERRGVWTEGWEPPRCAPVEYLERLGYLQPGLLVVHGVHLVDDDLEQLREAGAVLVACPRSNALVGAGLPRLAHFYASDVPVAIGTDSLASVGSLSVFDEMAEMRRIAPDVAAAAILDSATRVGAEALGFGADFGTLARGRRARFVAVDVPSGVGDVEEYLVSGLSPGSVRPLVP